MSDPVMKPLKTAMHKSKKRRIISALAAAFVVLAGLCAATFIAGIGGIIQTFFPVDVSDAMDADTITASNGIVLPYRIYAPENAAGLPLVLFLHGSGARGDDNLAQAKKNTVFQTLLRDVNRRDFPCVALAPQCPAELDWSKEGVCAALHELLDQIQRQFGTDPTRVYITGLSMGGNGTWSMLAAYPDSFAAAVPICGGGDPTAVPDFADVPIWVFHGRRDQFVPVQDSRDMVAALQNAQGAAAAHPVKYTEYPWENHACWELAYRDKELFPWMFSQHRD